MGGIIDDSTPHPRPLPPRGRGRKPWNLRKIRKINKLDRDLFFVCFVSEFMLNLCVKLAGYC